MCLVGWRHSSELNSCLFKKGVVEGTLGLVTCCQHIENEATMSHGIDSEGSSYLVTGHIDPALVNLATLHRNVQAGAGATVAWSSIPSCVPPKAPNNTNTTTPRLTLVMVSQLSFRQTGPHAGADTEAPKGSQQPYQKGIFGRGFSSGGCYH